MKKITIANRSVYFGCVCLIYSFDSDRPYGKAYEHQFKVAVRRTDI